MSSQTVIERGTIRPLRDGIVAGAAGFAAMLACIGWIHVRAGHNDLEEARFDLMNLAKIAASQVDADAHATLRSPAQIDGPVHRELLRPLIHLHRALPSISYVYTVIRDGSKIRFVLDTSTAGNEALGTTRTLTPSKIMDVYEKPDEEMISALEKHEVSATREPYQDEFGIFLSGYAPLFDSKGNFEALLGVDQSAADLQARLAANTHIQLTAAAGALVLSVLIGFAVWTGRRRSLRLQMDREAASEALVQSEERYRLAASAACAADRAKSDFLAIMSHEMRTPLNGALGFTQLLSETELTPRQRELVGIAQNCGRSLLTIIDDMLDFSKIEAGRLELENAPFELRPCLEDVLEICAASLHLKQVELCEYIASDVPRFLRGDVSRLRQVLFNLLGNAVKFTAQGDVIARVSMSRQANGEGMVLFEIQDDGPGIAPDRLERLFQPFSQADSSTTRRFGGTGLGLAICRRLVEAMGGEIGVRSDEGFGSTFYFTMPAIVADVAEESPELEPLPHHTVLLIEAPTMARRLRRGQLETWEVRCEVADDLTAARQWLKDGARFDAILIATSGSATEHQEIESLVRVSDRVPPCLLLAPLGRKEAYAALHLPAGSALLGRPTRQKLFHQTLVDLWAPKAEQPAPSTVSPAPAPAPSTGLQVLVAEDLAMNQLLVKTLLERMGCTVDLVETGRAAVEQSGRRGYNLILMDLQMPEMDGLEATAAIRRRETYDHAARPTKIVALTASAMAGERERCLAAGMDGYLLKPLDFAHLRKLVETTTADLAMSA